MTTVSAGIYLATELCALWLEGEKRAAVPFLLAVVPFYTFFGLKFDQNSALIPLWALTLWAFMRSLETRRAGWAVLTGACRGSRDDDQILVGISARGLGSHDTA